MAETAPPRTQETAPFAILSVDYRGNFASFSPELLGLPSRHYGDFLLGNVFADSLESAARGPRFAAIHRDIVAGIERCRGECPYFALCGGGAPANKYFENGSFDSTETLFCRFYRKSLADVLLDKLACPPLPRSRGGSPTISPEPSAVELRQGIALGLAPRFQSRLAWIDRVEINGGVEVVGGHVYPRRDWRRPHDAELALLLADGEGPTSGRGAPSRSDETRCSLLARRVAQPSLASPAGVVGPRRARRSAGRRRSTATAPSSRA